MQGDSEQDRERRVDFQQLFLQIGALKAQSDERKGQVAELFTITRRLAATVVTKEDIREMSRNIERHIAEDRADFQNLEQALSKLFLLLRGSGDGDDDDHGLIPRLQSLERDRESNRKNVRRGIWAATTIPTAVVSMIEFWRFMTGR